MVNDATPRAPRAAPASNDVDLAAAPPPRRHRQRLSMFHARRCRYICRLRSRRSILKRHPRVDSAVENATEGVRTRMRQRHYILKWRHQVGLLLFPITEGLEFFIEVDLLSEGYFCEGQDIIPFGRSRCRCDLTKVRD